MSADNKNNSSNRATDTNTDVGRISRQKIIEMSNRFYLEISKKVLSEREYDVMRKTLIGNSSFQSISSEYGITKEGIRHIYKKAFFKIKSVLDLVREINFLKERRSQLHQKYLAEYKELTKEKIEKDTFILDKKIIESHFPFSKRLWNMFNMLEIHTFRDLFEESLNTYPKFRGFKGKCLKEFIQFIEFENIEELFEDDFYEFKKKYEIS